MVELKKYVLVFCSITLLFPAAMGLAHINAHQDDELCLNISDTHFHEKTFKCELCDLRLTNLNAFSPENFIIFAPKFLRGQFFDSYQFLSDYHKLSYELRGPPVSA